MGVIYTPPRHAHRSPAELAEDEILAALRGDLRSMPEEFRETDADDKRIEQIAAARRLPVKREV